MGNKLLLIPLLFMAMLWHAPARAQACGDSFEEIKAGCVKQQLAQKSGEIKFKVPEDAAEIKGDTYFFITENGSPGKMMVTSGFASEKECSIGLAVTTYIGDQSFNPVGYFNITKEFNTWSLDKSGFDRIGSNDFQLYHKNGMCIFATNQAKGAGYAKIKQPELIQGRESLYYAGTALIFLAVFLVARAVFQDEDRFKAQSKLEDAEKEDQKEAPNDIVLKYSRPFFKRYITPVVEGMKNKKKIKDKYKRKLASAGMTKSLSPEDMYAFKLFLIIGFPIVYLALRAFLEEDWPLAAVPAISVLGFFYPDKLWLEGKIKQRKAELIENMPFIVDMLALSVEAGLDFMAAIQKVLDKAPPSAMSEEFEILIKETRVGASRAEGLRQLAWRCDCLQISSFTATLIAADAVGASIGPILKTLAGEMRQKRSAEAEKKGATAATKILFPMMVLIMPAVGLIIIAPIALQLMGD